MRAHLCVVANTCVLYPTSSGHLAQVSGQSNRKSVEAAPSGTEPTGRPKEPQRMAIFHLTAKMISRGKGQSAIAAAAYRSGERLRDEQAGEQKFYTARAERIEHTEIMVPKDAPEWARDRNQLWNEAERAERRKDAQLAREIEVSLPHELTHEQRVWLVKDFAREAFVRKSYAVDIAIHAPDKKSDERNHHAHLMVTRRTLGPEGFSATKDWKLDKSELARWREQWANLVNRHLERHGHDARVDHRSFKERGIEQEPGIHLGYAANEMTRRGAQSDRMDKLKGIIERNDIRLEIAAIDSVIARAEAIMGAEEEKKREGPRSGADSGLAWTDHAGMVAQMDSAMKAAQESAPGPQGGAQGGRKLAFPEDRAPADKAAKAPPDGKGGAKRLGFFEDEQPDKDIDRDR